MSNYCTTTAEQFAPWMSKSSPWSVYKTNIFPPHLPSVMRLFGTNIPHIHTPGGGVVGGGVGGVCEAGDNKFLC